MCDEKVTLSSWNARSVVMRRFYSNGYSSWPLRGPVGGEGFKDAQAIGLRFASQKTSDVGSSLPVIPSKGHEFASKESEDLI